MTTKQIWQTIALDLERAANLKAEGRLDRAQYFIQEAKKLYSKQKLNSRLKRVQRYIKFIGDPEEILLGSSLISTRI